MARLTANQEHGLELSLSVLRVSDKISRAVGKTIHNRDPRFDSSRMERGTLTPFVYGIYCFVELFMVQVSERLVTQSAVRCRTNAGVMMFSCVVLALISGICTWQF